MGTKNIEKEIYSTFANIASTIGYSEIHGRIIATLLVVNKKLSLQELARETGYSVSTLSLSLDLLDFLGMIKKVKIVGDKRLYVELQGNLVEGLKKAFMIKIQKNITDNLSKFKKFKENLKNSKHSNKKKILNTINILEKEVKRLDRYLNLLSKLKF